MTELQLIKICTLHYCISMDLLFSLSPESKRDITAPVNPEAIFPMQMLHAHIQNFFSDQHVTEQAMQIDNYVSSDFNSRKVYQETSFLNKLAIECISELLNTNDDNIPEIKKFIMGYNTYMAHDNLYKKIGEFFAARCSVDGVLWNLL